MYVPDTVGVPLIVIVLEVHDAPTPEGNPVEVPIPVAPVVVCVILVITVFTQGLGDEEAAPALFKFTIKAPETAVVKGVPQELFIIQ